MNLRTNRLFVVPGKFLSWLFFECTWSKGPIILGSLFCGLFQVMVDRQCPYQLSCCGQSWCDWFTKFLINRKSRIGRKKIHSQTFWFRLCEQPVNLLNSLIKTKQDKKQRNDSVSFSERLQLFFWKTQRKVENHSMFNFKPNYLKDHASSGVNIGKHTIRLNRCQNKRLVFPNSTLVSFSWV